jgi:hypothetical protein
MQGRLEPDLPSSVINYWHYTSISQIVGRRRLHVIISFPIWLTLILFRKIITSYKLDSYDDIWKVELYWSKVIWSRTVSWFFVQVVITGNLAFVSGQLPIDQAQIRYR